MVKINLDAIKCLSVRERVRLVQDIRDTVQPTASDLPLTEEQRAIVQERLAEYRQNPDAAIEAAWKVEIERRIEQMDRGEVEMIPAEDVLTRIRERFSL